MPKSKSEPVDLSKKQRYARSQSSLLSTTNNQVKKRENKPRSKSKSPRNSAIIPGVRISKLKLNLTPTGSSQSKSSSASPADPKKVDMTLDLKNEPTTVVKKAGWQGMAVSEIWADESPNVPNAEDKMTGGGCGANHNNINNTGNSSIIPSASPLPVSCTTSGGGSGIMIGSTTSNSKPQNQSIDRLTDESSMTSSICSTLDSIQPPSLMNSLISMSERQPSLPNSPKVSSKLECRHNVMNLSGKKGQKVPEMVRRALGQVETQSAWASTDLSSSISSCQSNLDNIKPPTDMDSSILSIASISSEIAEVNTTNHAISDR